MIIYTFSKNYSVASSLVTPGNILIYSSTISSCIVLSFIVYFLLDLTD